LGEAEFDVIFEIAADEFLTDAGKALEDGFENDAAKSDLF
jgi:hypothetical protein